MPDTVELTDEQKRLLASLQGGATGPAVPAQVDPQPQPQVQPMPAPQNVGPAPGVNAPVAPTPQPDPGLLAPPAAADTPDTPVVNTAPEPSTWDKIRGFIAGSDDPSTQDRAGLTQAQRRLSTYGGIAQLGATLMAAGQPMSGESRGRLLAQLGQVPQTMQQMNADQVAQNGAGVRQQADKLKLQSAKDQTTALQSPEVAAMVARLNPQQQLLFKTAPDSQKAAILERSIASNKPKIDANGNIVFADGTIKNGFGQVIAGPGGSIDAQPTPAQQTLANGPPAPAGAPQPQQAAPPATPAAAAAQTNDSRGVDAGKLAAIEQQYGKAVADKVKGFATYKVPFPVTARNQALMNPGSMASQTLQMIQSVNPDWDANGFGQQNALWKEFYGSGKTGQNITALDTAYGHIGMLSDLSKDLNGKDPQLVNQAVAKFNKAMGGTKYTQAEMAAGAVSHELAKVFRDTGMSKEESEEWAGKLDVGKNSGPQMKSAIVAALHLMEERKEALVTKYARGGGRGSTDWFTPSHTAKADEIRQDFARENPRNPGTAPAQPGTTATATPDPLTMLKARAAQGDKKAGDYLKSIGH